MLIGTPEVFLLYVGDDFYNTNKRKVYKTVELEDWFYRYNVWSYTKHRLWGICKRAYYYRYIGPALKSAENLNTQKLKRLKMLNSRFALQGILLHEVIENKIGQNHLGREMSESIAKAQYIQRVEQYRRVAKETLTEYFNGEPMNEAFFGSIRANGLDQISMFFGVIWPQLKDLEYLRHEKLDRFKVGDVEAIVKADYVSKTKDDIIVVSDWKTGANDEKYESELQIGVYVLWAMQYYEKEPEEVRSELVYLRTGIMQSYEFSRGQLEGIKGKVVDDFKDINRTFDIEYFNPDPSPEKCLSCQFATVCPHSMAIEQLDG